MRFGKEGRAPNAANKNPEAETVSTQTQSLYPSLVYVFFRANEMMYTCYNDLFYLKRGDYVFVEGRFEGIPGRVIDIVYPVDVDPADYRRVVGHADTHAKAALYTNPTHFICFDPAAYPYEKVLGWFRAPDANTAYSRGARTLPFQELFGMKVPYAVMARGDAYYREGRVLYLDLDGMRGRAIVEGGTFYESAFTYRDGEVSQFSCSCPCSRLCKHTVAAMLQFRELLTWIETHEMRRFRSADYFAAIPKKVFYKYVLDLQDGGRMLLS